MAQFRRPASLSLQRQEAIVGGADPALKDQVAHESAAALMAGTRHLARPEVVQRVLTLVEREGIEEIAALWSGAEESSLPGALWRIFVLHTWVQQDPRGVTQRFEWGLTSVPGLAYIAGLEDPPTIDSMRQTLDDIVRGMFTGDVAMALGRAAAVSMLTSYGNAHAANTPELRAQLGTGGEAPSSEELTTAAHRLLAMGEALEVAARAAARGELT